MSADAPREGSAPFPALAAAKETFRVLWAHKLWFAVRALPPTVLAGVTFIVTFPRIGIYAVWEMALFVISALAIANMMVSSHRLIVLGDPCHRFVDFLPRMADLTYFGVWLVLGLAKWIFDVIGAFLGGMVILAGRVFDLGVAILFFIVLTRLIALFPLVATRARSPFHLAWRLSAGHLGQLIRFCIAVGLVLAAALAAVTALLYYSQLWAASGMAEGRVPAIPEDIVVTLPFFAGALFLMLEFQAIAVAQSVAYRHLAGVKPQA